MKMHESITVERLEVLIIESVPYMDDAGVCVECGAGRHGYSPLAAQGALCEECGAEAVWGASELLIVAVTEAGVAS